MKFPAITVHVEMPEEEVEMDGELDAHDFEMQRYRSAVFEAYHQVLDSANLNESDATVLMLKITNEFLSHIASRYEIRSAAARVIQARKTNEED